MEKTVALRGMLWYTSPQGHRICVLIASVFATKSLASQERIFYDLPPDHVIHVCHRGDGNRFFSFFENASAQPACQSPLYRALYYSTRMSPLLHRRNQRQSTR